MKIDELILLVHPDFDLMRKNPDLPPHPEQIRLREAWESQIISIKDNPTACLVYISALPRTDLDDGLSDITTLYHDAEQYDIQRIIRWQEALRDKFILIAEDEYDSGESLRSLIDERELLVDTERVKITVFGNTNSHALLRRGKI